MGQCNRSAGLLLIIITNIDNLDSFCLAEKDCGYSPSDNNFGVIIGLSLFGFMGIIFGPLLISGFILCVDIFKTPYIEEGVSVDNEIFPDEVVPGDGQVKDEE